VGRDRCRTCIVLRKGSDRMKILHILYESSGDSFGMGGVGERAYQIYSHLKSRHAITLLCKKYPGAQDRYIAGLKHVFVGAESRTLTRTLLSFAYHASLFVRRHGQEYDIIIEEFSPATPTFLNTLRKTPVVLQIQGYTGGLYFRKYNPVYGLALYLLEHLRPAFYRNYIFVDENTRGRFLLPGEAHIECIPNGVRSDMIDTPAREGRYILYLGRVDIYGKGLDVLLPAFQSFCHGIPNIELVVAGDGRDMGKFRMMVSDLPGDVSARIRLSGWVSGDAKARTIQDALFLVLPSRHETQGIAVLEAMSAGKAVVTSDIPELAYVAKNKAGISFKCGDAGALSEAMTEMAASPARAGMGTNGRRWVRDMTWEKMAERFEGSLLAAMDRFGKK